MTDAETFIKDFHTKNQASLERHLGSLRAAIAKESLDVVDFLRLSMKDAIEAAEVAALWFVDCADLPMKLGFAEVERFEQWDAEQWFGVWSSPTSSG